MFIEKRNASEMKVIGIFSLEGGIGKTTHALALCQKAVKEGKRVMLLELGIVTHRFYRLFPDITTDDVFSSVLLDDKGWRRRYVDKVDSYSSFQKRTFGYPELFRMMRMHQGICIIPQSPFVADTDSIAMMMSDNERMHGYQHRLQRFLGEVKSAGYDLVVIDNDSGLINSAACALIAIRERWQWHDEFHFLATPEGVGRLVYEISVNLNASDKRPNPIQVIVIHLRDAVENIKECIRTDPIWRNSGYSAEDIWERVVVPLGISFVPLNCA